VAGFSSLSSVGGNFWVEKNGMLITMVGFNKLTVIDGLLFVSENIALTSLTGFNGLKRVKGDLKVIDNEHLVAVDGFRALSMDAGLLDFRGNKLACPANTTGANLKPVRPLARKDRIRPDTVPESRVPVFERFRVGGSSW
jgi:hypothetical protein